MNISNIIKKISNLPGYSSNKKIIVFESDDWGSIRMPSIKSLSRLEKKGLNMRKGDSERYNLNDTLASVKDLTDLFEILNKNKDSLGNPACFTALTLTANPDFDRIKESQFCEYFNEPFTKTLERYNTKESFSLWKMGEESGLFFPQYHGREHLNVVAWMRSLKKGDKETMLAFEEGLWAFDSKKVSGVSFQAPFDVEFAEDINEQVNIIKNGLEMFDDIYGKKAYYFVPPNGIINSKVEMATVSCGIKYISTSKIHTEALGNGKIRRHFRYLGKKNNVRQMFLTRNAFFEPNQGYNIDHVDSCLKDIEIAFKYKKPAVISTHRCNYIGSLNPSNSSHGLIELDRLLSTILKKWPDAYFMNSVQLGNLIANKV